MAMAQAKFLMRFAESYQNVGGHTSWYQAGSNRLRYKKEEEAEATLSLTDTPHIQSFTARSLSRMLLQADFQPERIINANLLQGVPILHKLLLKIPVLQRLDLALTPHLPKFLGNGWYFSAHYRSNPKL